MPTPLPLKNLTNAMEYEESERWRMVYANFLELYDVLFGRSHLQPLVYPPRASEELLALMAGGGESPNSVRNEVSNAVLPLRMTPQGESLGAVRREVSNAVLPSAMTPRGASLQEIQKALSQLEVSLLMMHPGISKREMQDALASSEILSIMA